MYTEHFGLKILPFENVPDPKFFFDEGDHARVRHKITSSLKSGRGLLVVTGPVGSGKTTLSQMIKADFSNELTLIWMALPPENRKDLFRFIASELGLTPSSTETVFILNEIRDALLKLNSEGGKCMIIIDESHMITDDVLDSIRILNNLEEGATKLIQLLLLGQDELMEIIQRPEMEPFKQRIATLEMIGKMNTGRIIQYITHRLKIAGGSASIFAETGWEGLCYAFGAECTPRTINSLCDRSLNAAYEKGKEAVDVDDVYEVAQTMGLEKEVYHYRLALVTKEKEILAEAAVDRIKEQESEHDLEEKIEVTETEEISEAEVDNHMPFPSRETSVLNKTETVKKNVIVPLLILTFSIVTLSFSLSSYCDKAGYSGIMVCLQ